MNLVGIIPSCALPKEDQCHAPSPWKNLPFLRFQNTGLTWNISFLTVTILWFIWLLCCCQSGINIPVFYILDRSRTMFFTILCGSSVLIFSCCYLYHSFLDICVFSIPFWVLCCVFMTCTDIPQKYCRFSLRPPQQRESNDFFGFPVHKKLHLHYMVAC